MAARPTYPDLIKPNNFWKDNVLCCGARFRSGNLCEDEALENGRCRRHGGMSTGPRTEEGKQRVAQNSRKYGLYSVSPTNDEYDMLADVIGTIGNLDNEIVDLKFQIRRVTIALREEYEGDWDGMRNERTVTRRSKALMIRPQDGDGNFVGPERPEGGEFETMSEKRAADLYTIYDRLMGRLQRMEQTRFILNGGGLGVADPHEAARLVKRSLREMAARTRAKHNQANPKKHK
jgi:hypothetical protein